jgi:hypothetical protein
MKAIEPIKVLGSLAVQSAKEIIKQENIFSGFILSFFLLCIIIGDITDVVSSLIA